MRQNPIHFIRCLILCLAGYAFYIPLAPSLFSGRSRSRRRPPHQRSITSCWRFRTSLLRSRSTAISLVFASNPRATGSSCSNPATWGCFSETAAGIGKSRVRVGNNRGSGCTLISRSAMLPLWSKKPAKLVTGLSRSQGNMILEPKLSLLTLMVTLGRLYLRQRSLPVAKNRPLRELRALGLQ